MSAETAVEKKNQSDGLLEWVRAFASADPRSLGLFRWLFGIFLLVDLYRRIPDMVLFYTNDGFLPNHSAIYRPMSAHLFSIYHAFSTLQEVRVAFALTGLVFLLYMVGYKTKLMQVLTLVLITSLHSRNIMLENGGDVVVNLLALWTVFLPLGARFSVDAMLRSLKERNETTPEELNDRRGPWGTTEPIVSLAYVGLVLNLALIYYFNTVHKDGPIWREGTTVHYVLWADRLVNPTGVWLRSWAPMWLIKLLTYGTLVIELSIAVMLTLTSIVWLRASRRVAALLIIALHSGLQSVGHFGLFSFVMMLHAPLLLGKEDWEYLEQKFRKTLPSRTVLYDATCGLCHQLARIGKRLDPLGKLTWLPNDREQLWPPGVTREIVESSIVVARPSDQTWWTGAAAIAQIFRALPYGVGVAKLLELPGLSAIAQRLYDAVAARRKAWSVSLGYSACGVPTSTPSTPWEPEPERPPLFPRLSRWVPVGLTLFFMVALFYQVVHENRKAPPLLKKLSHPRWAQMVSQYPRFFQGWSMFAPIPPTDDGIIVVDAVTVDGRHIDPLAMGGPVHFELPDEKHGNLMTQFWYEVHDRMRRDVNARYRDALRDYIMNWHKLEKRPPNDKIVAFEAYWVWRPTQPPGERTRLPTQRQKLFEHREPSHVPVVVPPKLP